MFSQVSVCPQGWSRSLTRGVSAQGVHCPGGSLSGRPPNRDPPTVTSGAVCILLECILVSKAILMPANEVAGRYRFHRLLSVHGVEGWEARQHHMHHWIDHMVRYPLPPDIRPWDPFPPTQTSNLGISPCY